MTQKDALDILKLGHNVFLTGPAGSGKTFVLNGYVNFLKEKGVDVGITASTGIAATHISGITIHSWAGIGIRDELTDKDIRDLFKKRHLGKRFERTKVLVIDEVSMLHHFRLDMIDKVCRMFKDGGKPFGGMQIILCGDFFQLPPIARNGEEAHFAHKSDIWNAMDLKVCYLDEQYRHNDNELITLLNDIRANTTGEHTLIPLRKRYKRNIENSVTPTKLYAHNIDVDTINHQELQKIEEETKEYVMKSRGAGALVESLKKSCLAPEDLHLKLGAVVMFVKNNFEKGFVNGTLGKIVDFVSSDEDEDEYGDSEGVELPVVETYNGKKIIAEAESWRIEEDGKIKAEITQIPLRLAWAITVHKSQGMSLDAAEIDLSKSFVEGMGYVALSRVRTLSGLKLMGLNKIALEVNKEILEFDKQLIDDSIRVSAGLQELNQEEKEEKQKRFLISITPKIKEKELSTHEKTKLLVEQKLSIKDMAKKREMVEGTIIAHLEKLIERKECPDIEYLKSSLQPARIEQIKSAFEKTKKAEEESDSLLPKLAPIKALLDESFSYDEIRLARLFL